MVLQKTENQKVINSIVDTLQLNPVTDQIPKYVVPTIQPVFEADKKICDIVRSSVSSTTGTVTVFTTPANLDFYLNSVVAGYVKDATCDIATGSINVQANVQGTTRAFVLMPVLTTTAQDDIVSVSFPAPIKIDRSAAITITGTFTAGAMSRAICISGFTAENNNQFSTG